MKRNPLMKALALAAVLSALSISSPGAEELPHYGLTVNTEATAFECLSCHDGMVAKVVKYSVSIGSFFCGHPINRNYPPVDKPEFYQPIEYVASKGINLLHGQVTCVSCHNLKNTEKPHLAVPIDRSDLCFACHKI